MQLNTHQQAAVRHISGPCLVLAGAGSGKTKVITQKIAYLIQQCGYSAPQITALTFTNKAAREMKTRVQQVLKAPAARGLWISTFHTLGLHIIRTEHQALNLPKNFSLFDAQDSLQLLKDLAPEAITHDKQKLLHAQNLISHWKNQGQNQPIFTHQATSADEQIIAKLYSEYQTTLTAYNALDFDDLLLKPTQLLQQKPHLLSKWQQKIRYLLIDEYQDTNEIQYQLIRLLTGIRARFTAVGDDDQSIYAWRGACPNNMSKLQDNFPTLNVIKLEQNYRSTTNILTTANQLIAHNPHLIEKSLYSTLGQGDPIHVIAMPNEEHEAQRVTAEIIRHQLMHSTKLGQYAILYRSNHQARCIEKALMHHKIPYQLSGGMSFFDRSEIKDLITYWRLLLNPDDNQAFLKVIQIPKRGIGPATLAKLGTAAQSWGLSLMSTCFDPRLRHVLDANAYLTLYHFAQTIHNITEMGKQNQGEAALQQLLEDIQYEQHVRDSSNSPQAADMRNKNVRELMRWMKQLLLGKHDEPMTLSQAIQRILLRDMLDRDQDETGHQVHMMTLHAAKGLEFPYVFMVGLEEGILPHQNSIDTDNIEEERRLAYVGITRAQRALYLTYCQTRKQFGDFQTTNPSRFLEELNNTNVHWQKTKTQRSQLENQQCGQTNLVQLRALLKSKNKSPN